MPRMQAVTATYIAAMGYDAGRKELHIRLADSKGTYVNAALRRNHQMRIQ